MAHQGITCNERTIRNLENYASLLCSFLHRYSFLTEAYVLDYFVSDHWSKLPLLWQTAFSEMEPQDLGRFLSKETLRFKEVFPLSLQAFRASVFALGLPRKAIASPEPIRQFLKESFTVETNTTSGNDFWKSPEEEFLNKSGQHRSLSAAFRRHVKPKKQHEIVRLSQVADIVLQNLNLNHVVDVGAGQGHLSRLLCFHHGYKVATIEAEHGHVRIAENFDKQAFTDLQKKNGVPNHAVIRQSPDNIPKHIKCFISMESSNNFLQEISQQTWPLENEPSFGLLGLHTCGNLASALLHLFTKTKQARALLSAGCCYMKLDTENETKGYPLSKYVSELPHSSLSYEAREVACHALELYIKRLYENCPSLRIHCYRATLEKLIIRYYPSMKHAGLHSVKHAEKMSFKEYALKALKDKAIHIPEEDFFSTEVNCCLQDWKKVIIVYSLRLLLAPIIESLVLLDRMLYLYENGCPSCIIPLFDPCVSPRNQVLISVKKPCIHTTIETQQ